MIALSSVATVVLIIGSMLVAIAIVLGQHWLEQTLAESRVLTRYNLPLTLIHAPSVGTTHRLGLIALQFVEKLRHFELSEVHLC